MDFLFFVYLGAILFLLLWFGRGEPGVLWRVMFHVVFLAVGVLLLWLNVLHPGRFILFCRTWYVPFLYLFLFEEVGKMIHLIQPHFFDSWVLSFESQLFRGYPTVWLQRLANPWLTELMSLCYMSYYFLIPILGLNLYIHREWNRLSDFILTNHATFFFCFLHYLFLPVAGPIFVPEVLPFELALLRGGPFTVFEQWLFFKGAIQGGAFPSSHVAVAVVVLIFAIRYGKYPHAFAATVTGLAISTVYNGYHYGVDVLYGVMIGIVFAFLCPLINRKWRRQHGSARGLGSPSRMHQENRFLC
jgi:membrane-associated phospholipid phosphatase